jgi:radical S-adenosyl methionine domain-containing protein 2
MMNLILYLTILGIASLVWLKLHYSSRRKVPLSVNYHFTRRCNKTCGFCFHTATTSHIEQPERAKEGLRRLKNAGMEKINFAGGEPFLYSKFLGEMIDFCKQDLRLESVSIVTNGSLVRENFIKKHGANIDILAVSCDSFDEDTNIKIGRGSGNQVPQLYKIGSWCREYGIKFKINTVVCRLNHQEDMNKHIDALQPFRWKCFQVLIVAGENDSGNTLRDARQFLITDQEYQSFCQRHSQQKSLVAESNRLMAKSYLILDEYMRFLDRDGRQPSHSILEVGVQTALDSVYWDEGAFKERGGIYDWTRKGQGCSESQKELDW